MEKEKFEAMTQGMIHFASAFKEVREILENAAKDLTAFLKSFSMEIYQKLGYPLGKSNRGFKKWQSKQLRKV